MIEPYLFSNIPFWKQILKNHNQALFIYLIDTLIINHDQNSDPDLNAVTEPMLTW